MILSEIANKLLEGTSKPAPRPAALVLEDGAVFRGTACGASGEGYCRVSYAYSVEHLTEALKRIREFLVENNIYHGN